MSTSNTPTSVVVNGEEIKDIHHGFGTVAIHAGQEHDPITGAVVPSISLATTYAQKSPGVISGTENPNSYGKGFEYSRTGNPTRANFERAMAGCEKAKHCVGFASGSAATSAILHLQNQGSHIISIDDVYGGTQRYFRRIATPVYGFNFTFMDLSDPQKIEDAITPDTKMLWMETPTNPTLKISNIAQVAEITKKHGITLVVDNTFMSPYFQNPLEHGADLVLHSVTKYIGGHSDVVSGVVCTNSDELEEKLRFMQNGLGGVPSPFDCYMALRGLKTLHVRMEAAQRNALALATFLEQHEGVEKVLYPGLPSHPQHEIAKKQMHGFGAMITFYVKGDLKNAKKCLETMEVFTLAESLGAVESLAESPAIMTHASVPPEMREKLGISDTLIRLSVGIESIADLLADMDKSVRAAMEA